MGIPLPTNWGTTRESNNSVSLRRGEFLSIDDEVFKRNPPPKTQEGKTVRDECLEEMAALEKKQGQGLSPEDQMNLSACYIRLGRHQKAINLLKESLEKLGKDDPYRFLLQANLAMAYWESGLVPRAVEAQKEALKNWPVRFKGWTWEQWQRYRQADRALLNLMQHRLRLEEERQPPSAMPTLDPLFLGVRFGGPGGKYVVGGLDPASADRLPADAEATVVQLILWLPREPRLVWYYAEVLNAHDKPSQALEVFDALLNALSQGGITELIQHRRALLQAGVELPMKAAEVKADRASGPAPTAAPAPLVDWRQLSVGFAAGALVAVIAGFQIQEWRRRRAVPRG
jgi:tetratricopeptide (TPR) repeat protein